MQLDQAALGLSREYLTKGFSEKLVDAYYKYLVDIAVTLGAKSDRAVKEIRESIEFEMKLANVSVHAPVPCSPLPSSRTHITNNLHNLSQTHDFNCI